MHAICQNCKIVLVEAASDDSVVMADAVNRAARAASIVSNSYGSYDIDGSLGSLDAAYDHPNKAVVVSSGDAGYDMSWPAALVPACACLLALVALFYEPGKGTATAGTPNDAAKLPANLAEIDQKMKDLNKKPREKTATEKLKSEDLEKLEAELDKIANKPRGNKEQIKERIKEMTALEDQMKSLEKEMAEKAKRLGIDAIILTST